MSRSESIKAAAEAWRVKQREAHRRHFQMGQSARIIAAILRIDEETVKKMLDSPIDKLWYGRGPKGYGKRWASEETIRLHLSRGLTPLEIARKLHVSESTIWRRIKNMGGIAQAKKVEKIPEGGLTGVHNECTISAHESEQADTRNGQDGCGDLATAGSRGQGE